MSFLASSPHEQMLRCGGFGPPRGPLRMVRVGLFSHSFISQRLPHLTFSILACFFAGETKHHLLRPGAFFFFFSGFDLHQHHGSKHLKDCHLLLTNCQWLFDGVRGKVRHQSTSRKVENICCLHCVLIHGGTADQGDLKPQNFPGLHPKMLLYLDH